MLTGNRPGAWLRLARHEMACLKERGDTAHLGIDAHTLACRRSLHCAAPCVLSVTIDAGAIA